MTPAPAAPAATPAEQSAQAKFERLDAEANHSDLRSRFSEQPALSRMSILS
jgi:hypothetical protein